MRRRVAAMIVGVLASPLIGGVAGAQEIREPIAGVCLRPLLGKILNLPLIDIPDQPIPKEPIELMLGGNDPKCHP